MNFSKIYAMNEAGNVAPASNTPSDFDAKQQALNIAQNQLQLIAKQFKEDPRVIAMINRYDKLEESTENQKNSLEHLTEAKKGSVKSYYNMFSGAASDVKKKIAIGIAIGVGVAVVGGVAGFGISKLVKAFATAKNAKLPIDVGGGKGSGATAPSDTGNANPATDNESAQPDALAQNNAPQQGTPQPEAKLQGATQDNEKTSNQQNTEKAVAPKAEQKPTIENSIEAQANAKPGDVLQRNDGTTHTLNQGDIDYAKNKVNPQTTVKTNGTGNAAQVNPTQQNKQDVKFNLESSKPKDDGFNDWKNDPKNAKTINSNLEQAKAARVNGEEHLKQIYNAASTGNVDALRTVQNKNGINDISGSGRSDASVVRNATQHKQNAQNREDFNKIDVNKIGAQNDMFNPVKPKQKQQSSEEIKKANLERIKKADAKGNMFGY